MPYALIFVSFGLCALAFAILALMLRPSRHNFGAHEKRLQIASLATCAWSVAAVGIGRTGLASAYVACLSCAVLLAIWLWQFVPSARAQSQAKWFVGLLTWAGPAVVLLGAIVSALPLSPAVHDQLVRGVVVCGLLLAALGLLAVEQMYRNATVAALPGIRWFSVGVGGIFVMSLVLYAEAFLMARVTVETWTALGFLLVLCALAIAQGARQMPAWSVGLFVSRHVIFYSTSCVLVGAYLLLMSLGGWALNSLDNRWARLSQALFTVGALLVLVLIVFSANLRRRLMVFISTHFFRNRYDYRLEWQRFIRTLSGTGTVEAAQQNAIRAIGQIVGSPKGVLWTRDVTERNFERRAIWPVPVETLIQEQAPASISLAAFLVRAGWLIDVRELARKPAIYDGLRFEDIPADVPADALIVPLLHIDELYGWLVLDRPADLSELTFEDRDLLKIAGRQVAAHLAQLDADVRLAEARQFEAYHRMTAFVMHDLKNLAAQLGLIVQNAARHKRNPEFVDDAMKTLAMSAERMSKLIAQLTTREAADVPQPVDLAALVERVAVRCGTRAPVPRLSIKDRSAVIADYERLAAVLEHAVSNAQDATPASGDISIEVSRDGGCPIVRVVDNGTGMDEAFVRDRLFRPFDTTKGARGMGIGAYQIREYMRALGGSVEVFSLPGSGTRVTLVFPFAEAGAVARLAG